MLRALFAVSAVIFATTSAHAQSSELDNEARFTNEQIKLAGELPGTVITRTETATGKVEVMHVSNVLAADLKTKDQVLADSYKFAAVDAKQSVAGELDQNSSNSSWYFYFTGYRFNCPTYYYYGYTYNYFPYYNYNWSGYTYTYYRWYW